MVGGIWMGGMGFSDAPMPRHTPPGVTPETQARFRELEHQLGRMALLNQALWELLRERLNLGDQDLERMARDIDMRDGIEDGRISVTALECPKCGRVSSSKHWRCLYCGQLFEKPAMG